MQIEKTKQTTNTTESSVLFSLASLGAMAKPAAVAVKPAAKVEDLLGIGATPSPVLAPPVIAPVAVQPPAAQSTRVWIACATIVALGILGGSYAMAMAMRPQVRVVERVSASEAAGPTAIETAAVIETASPTAIETVTATATVAATAPAPATPTRPARPHVGPVVLATPAVTEHAHEPPTLAELVERAAHPTPEHAPPPAAAAPSSTLPATPSRADVIAAMTGVTPTVTACGPDHGIATVQISVSHTGRITSAVVTGPLAGTSTGSCVARAVRGARFPEFSRDSFALTYPFRI